MVAENIRVNEALRDILGECPKGISYADYLVELIQRSKIEKFVKFIFGKLGYIDLFFTTNSILEISFIYNRPTEDEIKEALIPINDILMHFKMYPIYNDQQIKFSIEIKPLNFMRAPPFPSDRRDAWKIKEVPLDNIGVLTANDLEGNYVKFDEDLKNKNKNNDKGDKN